MKEELSNTATEAEALTAKHGREWENGKLGLGNHADASPQPDKQEDRYWTAMTAPPAPQRMTTTAHHLCRINLLGHDLLTPMNRAAVCTATGLSTCSNHSQSPPAGTIVQLHSRAQTDWVRVYWLMLGGVSDSSWERLWSSEP